MYCRECGRRMSTDLDRCSRCSPPPKEPFLKRLLVGIVACLCRSGLVRINSDKTTISGNVSDVWDHLPPNLQASLAERQKDGVIRIVNAARGESQVYDSLDEVPPDLRGRIEAIREQNRRTGNGKAITVHGQDGTAHTYQSVDEMPDDVRAVYEAEVLPKVRRTLERDEEILADPIVEIKDVRFSSGGRST